MMPYQLQAISYKLIIIFLNIPKQQKNPVARIVCYFTPLVLIRNLLMRKP